MTDHEHRYEAEVIRAEKINKLAWLIVDTMEPYELERAWVNSWIDDASAYYTDEEIDRALAEYE